MNNISYDILFVIFDHCELDYYKSISLVNETWNWMVKKL